MRMFFKVLFWIFFGLLVIISVHSLFNGGLSNMVTIIKQDGFFEFIKQYFIEIWNGFKITVGL